MYRLLREWPTHLYDTQVIVNAVDVSVSGGERGGGGGGGTRP